MKYRRESGTKKFRQRFYALTSSLLLPTVLSFCLTGCDRGAVEADTSSRQQVSAGEIPVDFPFYESENFTLTLALPGDTAHEYALRLCGEDGELLQQISCGRLVEPVTFAYDGLAYGSWRDLEVFSGDSDTGLFFRWEDGHFSEEPIIIPRYAEAWGGDMLTVLEDGENQEKHIYRLNEFRGRAEELRSWRLNRDSGMLKIEDCLRQQSLFEGEVALDGTGEPVNGEYFAYLFGRDLDLLWDYSADPTVYAWLNEESTEEDDSSGGESTWHTVEFENRSAFLKSCGYMGEEPTYRYDDLFGNLQLELYLDREMQQCYGIAYWNRINCDLESAPMLFGFTVRGVGEMRWEEDIAFSWLAVGNTRASGEEREQGNVIEYTRNGKPDYYLYQGPMEDCGVEYLGKLVEINFIYREDGTLCARDYYHDARTYGSALSTLDSCYDGKERLVYESGYLTHGSCEFYYFYEDGGEAPVYGLFLDYNGGYAIPEMVRFY